jgi:hypothetical protein
MRQKKLEKALLENSSDSDFQSALEEWEITGRCRKAATGKYFICELCKHNITWAFETYNHLTGNDLWIGRCCIKKYIREHSQIGIMSQDQILAEASRAIKNDRVARKNMKLYGL